MLSLGALGLFAWGLSVFSATALQHGRERLLAGSPEAAEAAFVRASWWPATARRATAGRALAMAVSGRLPEESPALADLAELSPVAVMDAALDREDLGGARATAELLVRAEPPSRPSLRRGGGPRAGRRGRGPAPRRRERGPSRVPRRGPAPGPGAGGPLPAEPRASCGTGGGRSWGRLDAEGRLTLADGVDPLLLPPFREEPRRRRRTSDDSADPPPFWLPDGSAGRAARTGGLRLTLDLDLARVAFEALGRWRGTIVLLEPRTGAILAAVSDPRTVSREGPAAFTQRREPASISKVLTTAAAYRAGIDADAAIGQMTCKGVERYGGQPLWCSWKAGPLDGLDQALAISCNTAFASLGTRVGRDGILAELRRWGFDAGPDEMMGAAGRVHTEPRNDRQLADLSIGLTQSDITPLHAALLATVVANGGAMPEPRLVAGPCGPAGVVDRVAVLPPTREVVSPRMIPRLRRAMRAVALYGTGTGLAPHGFPIAMKTGTAAEYRKGYHVNYIGIAPTPQGDVAFCVRITYRPNSRAVNRAAREVATELLARLAERRLSLGHEARRQRAHAAWATVPPDASSLATTRDDPEASAATATPKPAASK